MFRLAQSGVPCAFVINREGKIVWVGHPADVSKVVGEVLAGTYDMSVAAERVGKEAERARKIRELEAKYRDAQKAGDQARALEVIDEFVELSPEQFQPEIELKFKTLLVDMKDEKAAYAYARKVSEGVAKNLPEPLDGMAWLILEGEGVAVRDYDVALALAQRADELTNHGKPSVLETLARAYFEKGDIDKAIETQARAVAACDEKNSDRSLRAELSAGLQKYRAAKK
jgi:tetratricopeptide (TPR) repeat protein